jgi:hypothetical protein
VAVLGTKPAKEVEHLSGLADGLPDIAKRVASDVHVTLDEIAKLGLQIHGAVELVVAKRFLDAVLDDIRRGLGHADDGEVVLGNGVVEPAKKTLVHKLPVAITALGRGWRGGEMIAKTELANERIEESAPLGIVGFGELNNDRNMRFYVDSLEDGGGGRTDVGGGRAGVRLATSRRGGRRLDVGDIGVEKGIVFHSDGS